MHKITAIVPNYNHAPFLRKRIDSIFDQSYMVNELIILDDFSTDDSQQIIHEYTQKHPHIRTIFNDINSGSPFRQWVKGIELARNDIIWLAESDDFNDKEFINELLPNFKDQAMSLVFCQSDIVNEHDHQIGEVKSMYSFFGTNELLNGSRKIVGSELFESLGSHRNVVVNASAALFRKSNVMLDLQRLTNYNMAGDWYFWSSLMLQGNVAFNEKVLNHHRRHSNTVTSRRSHLLKSESLDIALYFRKQLKKSGLSDQYWINSFIERTLKGHYWDKKYRIDGKGFIAILRTGSLYILIKYTVKAIKVYFNNKH